jgi:hypothetical protein
MNIRVLLVDTIHISKRNFSSLYAFCNKHSIPIKSIKKLNHLKKHSGTWFECKDMLYKYAKPLKDLPQKQIFDYKYRGISLYHLYKHEMLSYVLAQKNWHSKQTVNQDEAVQDRLYSEYREVLIYSVAAAIFWIDYWLEMIEEINKYSHAIIFSGTHIYQRAFMKVSEGMRTRCVVTEHFFTGDEYYFEERSTPIANSTFARYSPNIDVLLESFTALDVKNAIDKVNNANNKNVKQPSNNSIRFFSTNKTVLILGQVANDYSLISSDNQYLSSIRFYCDIISSILKETDYNVIFKGHPWEEHKVNLCSDLTYQMVSEFTHQALTPAQRKRLALTKNFNIYSLFGQSEVVCALCSQGCLESCLYGHKPAIFGFIRLKRTSLHECP